VQKTDSTDSTDPLQSASVAAILAQRSRADRGALLDELVLMLTALVPDVRVERTLLRRRIAAVHVPLGEFVYVMLRGANDSLDVSRRHQVRGVVIRTVPLEIGPFLDELGAALEVELRRTDAGRAALARWLGTTDAG
jgi:hypothetical protein